MHFSESQTYNVGTIPYYFNPEWRANVTEF